MESSCPTLAGACGTADWVSAVVSCVVAHSAADWLPSAEALGLVDVSREFVAAQSHGTWAIRRRYRTRMPENGYGIVIMDVH